MFTEYAAFFFVAATAGAVVFGLWIFDKLAARCIDNLGEE